MAERCRSAMGAECNGAGQAFRLRRDEPDFDKADFDEPDFDAKGILVLIFLRAEG